MDEHSGIHEEIVNKVKIAGIPAIKAPPVDEIPACPFCHKFSVYQEKVVNHYPYYRCSDCNTGFYCVELRAVCKRYNKAVTQDQCKGCYLYNKNTQCSSWGGILEPPAEIKAEIKAKVGRNRGKVFQGRKVS